MPKPAIISKGVCDCGNEGDKIKRKIKIKEEEIRAAYKMGYDAGNLESKKQIDFHFEQLERRLLVRINLIKKTNGQLLNEILKLDKSDPLVGVLLTYDFADCILDALRKSYGARSYYARRLKAIINKSNRDWNEIFKNAEIMQEIKNADLEK